jgi:hypothetical protein
MVEAIRICMSGGSEADRRALFASAIHEVADSSGQSQCSLHGEWVDDRQIESRLRNAGWAVQAPLRRRLLFASLSLGSLVATATVDGRNRDAVIRTLEAGWNEDERGAAFTASIAGSSGAEAEIVRLMDTGSFLLLLRPSDLAGSLGGRVVDRIRIEGQRSGLPVHSERVEPPPPMQAAGRGWALTFGRG